MDQNAKTKFMQIYANLPMNIRKEIIAVVDGEAVTWNVAFLEIRSETKIGEKILNNLKLLDIL